MSVRILHTQEGGLESHLGGLFRFNDGSRPGSYFHLRVRTRRRSDANRSERIARLPCHQHLQQNRVRIQTLVEKLPNICSENSIIFNPVRLPIDST